MHPNMVQYGAIWCDIDENDLNPIPPGEMPPKNFNNSRTSAGIKLILGDFS